MSTQKPRSIAAPALGAVVLCSASVWAFLTQWEGREHRVYADALAGGLPTVCDGITRHVTKTPIIVGEVWTDEQCDREKRAALTAVQHQLLGCFTVPPPQSVFDAATSHAWNVGAARTCKSHAMTAWRAGEWAKGCRRLLVSDGGSLVWVYANGQFVRGLANRRAAEMVLCERDL